MTTDSVNVKVAQRRSMRPSPANATARDWVGVSGQPESLSGLGCSIREVGNAGSGSDLHAFGGAQRHAR